jgi:methionine sulfoxide reductase heme-binding subunit
MNGFVLVAVLPDKFTWYLARSSGMVAWLLVTGSVVWGIALAGRIGTDRVSPAWMLDLHRFLGGTATSFLGVHIAALVADNYAHYGWREVLVPFTTAERATGITTAVAWGIIAMYLLVAVELTSLLRRRLPRRVWRRVHYLSFPLFVLCTVHGFQAGTDRAVMAFGVSMVAAVCGTTVMTVMRLVARTQRSRRRIATLSD